MFFDAERDAADGGASEQAVTGFVLEIKRRSHSRRVAREEETDGNQFERSGYCTAMILEVLGCW